MVDLTEGAVVLLSSDKTDGLQPVLQATDVREVSPQQQGSAQRFRLLLSDGTYVIQGMLGTQKNGLVYSKKLVRGSVVRLTSFVINNIQNRIIVIIIDLEVLEQRDIIGTPVPLVSSKSGSTPKAVSSIPQSLDKPNAAAVDLQQPRMDNKYGTSYSNSDTGRYGSSNSNLYSKMDSGVTGGSVPYTGPYSNQNSSPYSPRTDVACASSNVHGRSIQQAFQQPGPMYMNRGPISKNEAPPRIVPIAALNPYQGRWTIKARVTAKSELRHYNNPRGDGKVFSFDLLDSDGGEIRVTCFNAVADQFYNQIDVGKIYIISKGNLKPAQKNFNHLHNDHEIFLESTSTVQLCSGDDTSIPKQQFHFRPISDIEEMENNSIVDLIGIVSSISPSSSIMRKNGTETQKRTLQLKDMSGRSVEITLWGSFCNAEGQTLQQLCDSGAFPVLAVKSGRVNNFSGKTVGTISTSQLFLEPDFAEAFQLRQWFDREGRTTPTVSISRESANSGRTDVRKTISQIKDEKLGTSEKPDWITVCAAVSFIKVDNFCYTACPEVIGDRQCNKKVTNNGDGKWRCEKCDKSFDECDYRYILQFQLQDHTGITWVTAFQECGEEILGISAKSLYFMKYNDQDDEKFGEIIRKVLFSKYLFKLKVKEETFSDESRVKSTVMKAEKVNFVSEFRYLLSFMDKLKDEDSSSAPKPDTLIPNAGQNVVLPGNVGIQKTIASAAGFMGSTNSSAREPVTTQAKPTGQYGNQYSGFMDKVKEKDSSTAPKPDTLIPTAGQNVVSPGNVGMQKTMASSTGYMGSTNSSDRKPVTTQTNQTGQYGNPYSGSTFPTSTYVSCNSCGGAGHSSANCPSIIGHSAAGGGGYGSSISGSNDCYKCHQPGHWARDCPGTAVSNNPPAYGSSGGGTGSNDCYKCHQPGHWARDCPGVSNVPPAYGTPGKYGGTSRQHVGGF